MALIYVKKFNTKHLAIVSGLKIILFVGGQSLHHKLNISSLNNGNHAMFLCFTHCYRALKTCLRHKFIGRHEIRVTFVHL
jgi:hypothetical protein